MVSERRWAEATPSWKETREKQRSVRKGWEAGKKKREIRVSMD